MDGTNFYHLAIRLSQSSRPEDLRSATSRAYYAAFHKVNQLLRSFGINLPSGPECHTKLRMILSNSGDKEVVWASSMLTALRAGRNAADYDMTKATPEMKKTVVVHLQLADKLMTSLDRCFPGGDLARVRDAIRQYAKDVLRLPVS